jgi:hypothetical protein
VAAGNALFGRWRPLYLGIYREAKIMAIFAIDAEDIISREVTSFKLRTRFESFDGIPFAPSYLKI